MRGERKIPRMWSVSLGAIPSHERDIPVNHSVSLMIQSIAMKREGIVTA